MPLKIRNQHLDAAIRHSLPRQANGFSKDECAAVRLVVAIDRCDDGVLKPHPRDRFGHPRGLGQVELGGAAVRDGAVQHARVQTSPRIMKVAVP